MNFIYIVGILVLILVLKWVSPKAGYLTRRPGQVAINLSTKYLELCTTVGLFCYFPQTVVRVKRLKEPRALNFLSFYFQ